jgi:uncharacterized membrane protein
VPHGADWHALTSIVHVLLPYIMSFVFLGIYWNNHHHMLHATVRINGAVLWANLHLLFWLSLVPFVTEWIGEFPSAALPTAVYGVVLICAAVAYTILQNTIIRCQGPDSTLAAAVAHDVKGKLSIGLYLSAIALAFVHPWIADAIYVVVVLIWLVPDRRIESKIAH